MSMKWKPNKYKTSIPFLLQNRRNTSASQYYNGWVYAWFGVHDSKDEILKM